MTSSTTPSNGQRRPDSTRLRLIAIAIPLLIGLGAVVVASLFKNSLPDPVATHWGSGEAADGFSSRTSAIWQTGIGGLVGAALVALSWGLVGRATSLLRAIEGTAVGAATFMSSVVLLSLWTQRGLANAADASLAWWIFPVGIVLGLCLGWLAAAVIGAADPDYLIARNPIPADAARLEVSPGEQAAWAGWSRPSVGSLVVVGVLVVVVAVIIASDRAAVPLFAALTLVAVVALVVATMLVRVTVGRNGLVARSIVGFTLFRVPLDQVQEATTTEVHPLRQFGGWGLRLGRGYRLGLITSAGSALEVERGDGSRFVVTIPRPKQPAALLNTLADQARTL